MPTATWPMPVQVSSYEPKGVEGAVILGHRATGEPDAAMRSRPRRSLMVGTRSKLSRFGGRAPVRGIVHLEILGELGHGDAICPWQTRGRSLLAGVAGIRWAHQI
jgi:hypothetical protein